MARHAEIGSDVFLSKGENMSQVGKNDFVLSAVVPVVLAAISQMRKMDVGTFLHTYYSSSTLGTPEGGKRTLLFIDIKGIYGKGQCRTTLNFPVGCAMSFTEPPQPSAEDWPPPKVTGQMVLDPPPLNDDPRIYGAVCGVWDFEVRWEKKKGHYALGHIDQRS